MKKIVPSSFLIALFSTLNFVHSYSQIAPFSLSPQWYFGFRAGLDFNGGPPVVISNGSVNGLAGQEGSSNICDPSGTIVFSTDSYRLYDGNKNFVQFLKGGTSSTQSSVCIPDPADPVNRFYLFTANVDDNGGGEKPAANADLGIHYYQIQRLAGGSISVLAGPVKIADHNEVTEQLCSGTDGNGNYWVVTHQGGNFPPGWGLNKIFSWKVTSAGVSSRITSSIAGTTGNNYWHGAMKINKCQTRLAAVFNDGGAPGSIEIYEWDASTGTVTSLIRRIATGLPNLYGCEFSPNGQILYFTTLSGNRLYQLDITSGDIYTDPTWTSSNNRAWMGTLQLGPDNKIYVINAGDFGVPAYIGVVNDPNVSGAGCNYDKTGFLLNAGPALTPNIDRGIANIAWLNPTLEIIQENCPQVNLSYQFKTYFNDPISVVTDSEEWDFGDGNGFVPSLSSTPSFTYTTDGNYTLKLKVRDVVCKREWTTNKVINITAACILPVTWLSIEAHRIDNRVKITWSTMEEENNGYFVIEKSLDGVNYTSIGTVKGAGNFRGTRSYEYYDESPEQTLAYYRIKQVDYDGKYEYGPIVALSYDDFFWNISWNQPLGNFTIITNSKENLQARVLDMSGKEVLIKEFTGSLNFGKEFPSGAYLVKLFADDKVYYKKVVK